MYYLLRTFYPRQHFDIESRRANIATTSRSGTGEEENIDGIGIIGSSG
jgi:hypothetical protein